MQKVVFRCLALILLFVCVAGVPSSRAADKPLTSDDVTLLLIGGASSQKMVDLIKERGIAFKMTGELANGFRRDDADEAVIQALESASGKAAPSGGSPAPVVNQPPAPPASSSRPTLSRPSDSASTPSAAAAPASAAPAATAPSAPAPSAPGPGVRIGADGVSTATSTGPGPAPAPVTLPADGSTQTTAPSSGSASGPVLIRHAPVMPAPTSSNSSTLPTVAPGTTGAAAGSRPSGRPELSEPDAAHVQQIIQAFAAKETMFKQARDNYTYHQINKVEEIGPDGEVRGQYQQDWDILYDDNGSRIERVTYAPLDSLKSLQVTQQDIDAFRSIQPFVLTTAELPEYDIQYKGHVQVDQITAYVFSIRPKEIQKGRQYFQGMAWVDDRDLQIVKSEGKQVPEIRMKHGEENLFPRFTTWREQIDGKFWFPTFTLADDTLYFSGGPVHIKEIIRYTDYKQFKSTHKITSVASVPGNTVQQPSGNQNPPKTPRQ